MTTLRLKIKELMSPGSFVANFGKMITGNVCAQIIGMLCSPIITRIFTPADFGAMTLISSLIAFLAPISTLRYDIAVVLPKTKEDSYNLLAVCLLNSVIVFLLLNCFIFLTSSYSNLFFDIKNIDTLLWFVPFGVLVFGLQNSLSYWHTREKNFTLLGGAQVVSSLSLSGYKVILGFLCGSSAFVLISGNLIGQTIVLLLFFYSFSRLNWSDLISSINKKQMMLQAKKYIRFPQFNLSTAIINSLSQGLPIFIFAKFYSADVLGFYGLASVMLRKPIALISNSIRKVFLQHAAATHVSGMNLRVKLLKTTIGLILLGIIPFGFIAIFGKACFALVFGAKWAVAGFYAQLIAPWLFLGFINPPATQVIIVKQKLFFNLIYDVSLIVFRALAIILGYLLSPNPWVAIAMFSFVGASANLYLIYYAFVISGASDD